MWKYEYKDYPLDTPLKENTVEPGRGIKGCEMKEVNGWNETNYRQPRRVRKRSKNNKT